MSELVTPTDYELRAAMKALILAPDPTAFVYVDWKRELMEGHTLNSARNAQDKVIAATMTLRDSPRERRGTVPYDPAKAAAEKYAADVTRSYQFLFVYGHDDAPVTVSESPLVTKSTEQLFNEWLDAIIQKFSRAPKLGQNARVDWHDELQVVNRRLPSYGGEWAHTADGLLTVHLHETIKPE